MESINKKLKYYELLMVCNNLDCVEYALPQGYHFEFYSGGNDIDSWIDIHISSGEFTSKIMARKYFYDFYSSFLDELDKRLVFIVCDKTNEKVATATLSKADEFGYSCVIDWFAISALYQGKKLSKPLLTKIFSIAKSLNYDKILLHTQTHTFLAAKIYLDFGFEVFNADYNHMGYRILKTLINHPKLQGFTSCDESEMYDTQAINIVSNLDKMFSSYTYEIWNLNGRNDVYVRSDNTVYCYKFYDNGNRLVLTKGEIYE